MASRTQSRYQAGLPYDPALAESSYRPERRGGAQYLPGDYGVTPIPGGGSDAGGVVAPQLATEGGSGLGGAGLGGLALSLLTNPNLLRQGTNLLNGLVKPGTDAAVGQEAVHQGAWGDLVGSAPNVVLGGAEAGQALLGSGWGPALEGSQVLWLPGGVDLNGALVGGGAEAVADGGGLSAELLGSGLGNGGAGSWLSGLQGTAFTPVGGGVEGFLGSGLLGGGFDWMSGLGTLGGGLLGNYMVSQAPYEGDRDPTGKTIGAGLGSAVGGLFLGPIGAFLGAQFGGMIGGQFGPEITFGPISEVGLQRNNPTPGWQMSAAADNGGTPMPEYGSAFQNALDAYVASHGYEYVPGAQNMFALGYNPGGEGTRADGSGYYIRPGGLWASGGAGSGPGSQLYFGENLTDAWASPYSRGLFANGGGGSNQLYAPVGFLPEDTFDRSLFNVADGATVGDAMVQYMFNDLLFNGTIQQQGGTPYQRPFPANVGNPVEQSVG